jgi:GT2 family glycosyltransferase
MSQTDPDAAPPLPPFPPDVDVGIVAFNARETLPRALDCLRRAGTPTDQIAIYDMASTDDSVGWLAREWPGVTVVRLDHNNGPDPGRNLALRSATRPYLLLLDADAYVRPDAPARLRAALDPYARVGTAVPVVVHTHDPDRLQYAGGSMHFICEAINPYLDQPLAARGTALQDIGAAPGVAYLIDVRVAHHIGLFDDRYFIGKEDGDFCHRLVMAGYRLVEDPLAIVEHQSKPRSAWLFPCQIRNRWHFLLKNYELRTLLLLLPALAIHEPVQLAVIVRKGHFRAYAKAVRGLMPWLTTIGRERREIGARRVVHDRDLFFAAPLVIRDDLVGGGVGRTLKRAYDVWLRGYWRVIRPLLP